MTNVRVKKSEGCLLLTIDRPQVLNALSPAVLTELAAAVEETKQAADVKAVIITGGGGPFYHLLYHRRPRYRHGRLLEKRKTRLSRGVTANRRGSSMAPKILTAAEAVGLIKSGDTVAIEGF